MKPLWNRLMARVDALSLRERVLLFAGVIAIFAVLTDYLFVTPLTQQQKILSQNIDQQSEDSESRRDQLLTDLKKRDRERVVAISSDLSNLQAQINELDLEISNMGSSPVDASALPVLLDRVLKRTERVALVKITSLKPETAEARTPAPSTLLAPAAASQTGVAAAPSPPARPALDVTLAGNYLDVMEYLQNLEKSLPSVRWSAMRLTTDTVPPQVTVRMLLPAGAQ